MQLHLLSGFLGSGKTTLIATAARRLQALGKMVAVITNDQGSRLVDSGFFRQQFVASRQVPNGCFCCNYKALDKELENIIAVHSPVIVFAESVGSCTDIIATVLKPMQQYHPSFDITITTVADIRLFYMLFVERKKIFDESVQYIYEKQLDEAGLILFTRADVAESTMIEAVGRWFVANYPYKRFLFVDAHNDEHCESWLETLEDTSRQLDSLDIDYNIYAKGEGKLAWLDRDVEIYSRHNNANSIAVALSNTICDTIVKNSMSIGHLKFLINEEIKLSFTNTSKPPTYSSIPSSFARMLINARVQSSPEQLNQLVNDVIFVLERSFDCTILTVNNSCFKPGFPNPVHRFAN